MLLGVAGGRDVVIAPRMANRHGLITGATGTGKTVTLQTMAEGFSALGVPVFMADIKGDLSGIARPGHPSGKVAQRIADLGLAARGHHPRACPAQFFDVFGRQGHPFRTTVSEMGPLLLSRILGLNEVQSGLMHLVFRVADDQGLLLLDLKDLRSMLAHVSEERQRYQASYGNISPASVGAVQRGLLRLEEEGGDRFLGEPAIDIGDLMQTDGEGRGVVSILAADALVNSPRLYSSLLLWLLSELFEALPERGDADRPRLVFFFDEAHLLFKDAAPALLEKIEQVVRLIRSRGVGVYFVTQHPADIPDTVLGQLGNRVQHALRAFTPRDQKALRAAASSFRQNPAIDAEAAIAELGVGEALISTLDPKGVPGMVERALVVPPEGQVGPITPTERQDLMASSLVAGVYEREVDRESAYEILARHAAAREEEQRRAALEQERERERRASSRRGGGVLDSVVRSATRSISSSVGRQIGNALVRGLLGGLFRK
ncbi:MAG: DUF853 domain-containing protein [Succinivibrionaceae bacterium]|nr:DUF853 domain-containing protein [Succinivibrionaceae bacterium]